MSGNEDKDFQEKIASSVKSHQDSKKGRAGLWGYVARVTTIGWLLVLPVVAGAYLGRHLDLMRAPGQISWTITLILLGIAIGIYNVWYILSQGWKK